MTDAKCWRIDLGADGEINYPTLDAVPSHLHLAVEPGPMPRFVSPEWEGESTLAEMLADNAHDDYVCEWLRCARVGDRHHEHIVRHATTSRR